MDDVARDERMRRLQRVAYGAVASDAERDTARAELEALRREPVDSQAARVTADAVVEPAAPPVQERTPTGSMRAVSEWIAASDAASVRRFRWAIAAGTAALLVGVGIGWHVGSRAGTLASDPIAAEAALGAPELNGFLVALDDTAIPRMFEIESEPADVPRVPTPDERIAPDDYRLLVTRPDGVALHVARLAGSDDVCAVVVMPDAFSASACTRDGMFPEGGLWVEAFVPGDLGLIRGTIHPNGTAELTPRNYRPGPVQVAEG
jgi:hypothetical protein